MLHRRIAHEMDDLAIVHHSGNAVSYNGMQVVLHPQMLAMRRLKQPTPGACCSGLSCLGLMLVSCLTITTKRSKKKLSIIRRQRVQSMTWHLQRRMILTEIPGLGNASMIASSASLRSSSLIRLSWDRCAGYFMFPCCCQSTLGQFYIRTASLPALTDMHVISHTCTEAMFLV